MIGCFSAVWICCHVVLWMQNYILLLRLVYCCCTRQYHSKFCCAAINDKVTRYTATRTESPAYCGLEALLHIVSIILCKSPWGRGEAIVNIELGIVKPNQAGLGTDWLTVHWQTANKQFGWLNRSNVLVVLQMAVHRPFKPMAALIMRSPQNVRWRTQSWGSLCHIFKILPKADF